LSCSKFVVEVAMTVIPLSGQSEKTSVETSKEASLPARQDAIEESHDPEKVEAGKEKQISLWTWRTVGVPINGFAFAFFATVGSGVVYGFFLGYLGLASYVLTSVAAIMRLPEVLLLPLGVVNDCFPIKGYHRKPYLQLSWLITSCALLLMCFQPLPEPYYCQQEDGTYGALPCNPSAQDYKNWYVFPLCLMCFGVVVGSVAGEGLLLEYAQLEAPEQRGQIKAEMTMVTTAGQLCGSMFLGIFMNGKEYLGTFDWGLSFTSVCKTLLGIAMIIVPVTHYAVHEPRKSPAPRPLDHIKSSWRLMQNRALASVLFFAFVVQLLISMSSTAGPMVRSQWAGVKVLQQQMFGMLSTVVMMLALWMFKVYFLQACWRKVFLISLVLTTTADMIPVFLTVFNVVRNQYFFLGEEVLTAIPTACIALVASLLIIEMSEPGCEGLCYGLIGTLQRAAIPVGAAISNGVFGFFRPGLSDAANYVEDTPDFRMTVGWSYVLTYATSFVAVVFIPLLPRQKKMAQERKKEWGHSPKLAIMVLAVPACCLAYSIVVLVLASQPQTACLHIAGGEGCPY